MNNSILPTYSGENQVIIKMIQEITIMNPDNPYELIIYLQSKRYKVERDLAKDLSSYGYCFYVIKFELWLEGDL